MGSVTLEKRTARHPRAALVALATYSRARSEEDSPSVKVGDAWLLLGLSHWHLGK